MTKISSQLLGRLLVVAIAYFVTGKLGLLIPYVGSHITLIWLPTGIAVAALMRWGFAMWPAIFMAAFAVNFSLDSTALLALNIAVGNTLAPISTAWLLRRMDFSVALHRAHDIFLMVCAACAGMTISASGGVLSLLQHGVLTTELAGKSWLIWWVGDTVGVVLVLPVLLNISKAEVSRLWLQRNRYLLWCGIVSVLELGIFLLLDSSSGQFMLLAFLVLPLVIWAAIRFGITGASLAVLGLSIIAVWATANAHGPFYQGDIHQGTLALWVFMCTLALVALMITVLQSERELSERALGASEVKLRAVIEGALDAIVTMDEHGCLVEFNPAAERIFGYTRNQVLGRPLADVMISPALRAAHHQGFQRYMKTGEKHIFDRRMELTAMRADGTEFPVELTITSIEDKKLPLVTGFLRDITERKRAEEEIRNLAFYDALTGLPNRRLLIDRMQQALASSARSQNYGAVLFIDLDNFKMLNDSRGHDLGDQLLVEVAGRLRNCVRAEDTVSRLGGDEFVIIVKELSIDPQRGIAEAKAVGEKILDAINQPYSLMGSEHHNTSSIGLSFFHGDQISVDELLKRADTAMYQAKAAGRNTLRFFDPAMQANLEKRVELESQLRLALSQNQLLIHYQSQVDKAGVTFGAEVLLRWQHPVYGLMSPVHFIPLAEESGLIVSIGRWVIQGACQQLKNWEQLPFFQGLQLAVNVSAKQFRQANFVAEVTEIIASTGANPQLLKLELTESMVLENIEDTIQKMQALRMLGIRFAMDDFGTGYSSLSYLKRLPLSQVKIDQSFVRDITIDPSDAVIVQAIVGISKTLGLNVIAEGVETKQQFDLLKDYGCKQFQGYLFSRPLPLIDFEAMLHQGRQLFPTDSSNHPPEIKN